MPPFPSKNYAIEARIVRDKLPGDFLGTLNYGFSGFGMSVAGSFQRKIDVPQREFTIVVCS